ncbi:histone deacetylase 2-like [Mangifera indica]|uniref:histone deacetylase 2-like n=1 Tax=Mangifera indica TaxID=29780 RepID=UPI001CF9CA50|nr:histone deacetylase 2-like [Mangifera indica]XP_044471396.1 histone deacetylase 2-like [Mangifera indica]XP_044471397.1 histone deacetylase 2-like [Mangifera indica]
MSWLLLRQFPMKKQQFIPVVVELTQKLSKPIFYILLAFATVKVSHSLYRYLHNPTMASSSLTSTATDAESLRRNRILSSKLYFDVPPSKVPIIYSPAYNISFLGLEKLHPFDSSKWGSICRFLNLSGVLDKTRIVEPIKASKEDLLVVHTESYLDSLKSSLHVAMILEVPPVALLPNCLLQMKVLNPFRKQVGGTILAGKLARERGWAINIGGGFHHSSANKGGGFCAYADISLCIHYAFVKLNISRVMIIDLDVHQGNGHEKDFSDDRRVYILDMYNPGIYPFDHGARKRIDQKVEVVTGTTTDEYLKKLDDALEVAGRMFDPELVVYNAGTDVLDGDPLGEIKISPEGIAARDEKVFRFARSRNIPIVMLTSGGYMKSSARVIADSVINLSRKGLIDTGSPQ